jgi:protein-tyrosine phosphatase
MADGPLSEFTAYRLTAMGFPFDGERFPIQLSEADLENADLVVALKRAEHHAMMLNQFPNWPEKIQYWHVDDIDCATPNESMPICESCVKSLVKTLLTDQKRQESPTGLRRAKVTSKIVFGPKRFRIY